MITYSIKESYVYLTFIVWYSFSCLCLIIIFMAARYCIEFLTIKFEKSCTVSQEKKITGRAIGCTIQIKYRIHELKFQGFVRLLKYKIQV